MADKYHEINWIHDDFACYQRRCSKCGSREVMWCKFIGYHDEADCIDSRCEEHKPRNRKRCPVEDRIRGKANENRMPSDRDSPGGGQLSARPGVDRGGAVDLDERRAITVVSDWGQRRCSLGVTRPRRTAPDRYTPPKNPWFWGR